jgi:hypothetical protein
MLLTIRVLPNSKRNTWGKRHDRIFYWIDAWRNRWIRHRRISCRWQGAMKETVKKKKRIRRSVLRAQLINEWIGRKIEERLLNNTTENNQIKNDRRRYT